MMQTYQDFVTSPPVDIKKIRAVTDLITKDASIIPVNETVTEVTVMKPNVVASFWDRSSQILFSAEDWWMK